LTFFLAKMGIVKPQMLSQNRKYALLIIVILAGVLTPGPDPISQIMMAVPVYVLYEVSIVVAKFAKPRVKEADSAEEIVGD
ncbi:MAG: twin-arginine translocase subunit TatC, partial [Firmicutes bacterium]|nr:twin-arginine translocase subunit TatC [Bacillota bacterium]